VLDGGDGADQIAGLYGNDVLTGGAGPDTFAFKGDIRIAFLGVGDDAITDFEHGVDRIEFATLEQPLASFADVAANLSQGPNGAVLTVPGEGTITFLGIAVPTLDASDFSFDGSNPVSNAISATSTTSGGVMGISDSLVPHMPAYC
jgi:RTX calcium-binding nonapeptide repeat (4 copies)